jgi:DNA-directed RNA polymerase subunit K
MEQFIISWYKSIEQYSVILKPINKYGSAFSQYLNPKSISIGVYFHIALLVPMGLTKFEKARIIGSRALQISMGAPVIIDIPKNLIDPVEIAILEFDNDVIPITIKKVVTS